MTTPDSQHTTQFGPKRLYNTPNPFEQKFGYNRAIRKGPFIFVSGTTALKDVQPAGNSEDQDQSSKVLHPHDARQQASVAMERCVDAVVKLGGARSDVVRVRMYVSRFEDCSDVGAAFSDSFGKGNGEEGVAVVATMVVVKDGFVDPDILVEVEVDAVV